MSLWSNNDRFRVSPDEVRASKEETYDLAVVEYLLRKTGQSKFRKEIMDCHERQQTPALAAFNLFCSFPLHLVSRKISKLFPESLFHLLNRPTKHPLIEEYLAMREEYPTSYDSATLGMVFPWTGFSKFVLLHSSPVHLADGEGIRVVWRAGRAKRLFVLETLDSFLDAHDLIV